MTTKYASMATHQTRQVASSGSTCMRLLVQLRKNTIVRKMVA